MNLELTFEELVRIVRLTETSGTADPANVSVHRKLMRLGVPKSRKSMNIDLTGEELARIVQLTEESDVADPVRTAIHHKVMQLVKVTSSRYFEALP